MVIIPLLVFVLYKSSLFMSKSSGSLTVPKKSVNMVFSHMFVVVVVRFGHWSATGGHDPQ
jgi:hypothetical protein